MIVHIEGINKKPRMTKNGESMSVGIITKEYPDKWMNGWEDNINKTWKKGDIVEVVIKENGQYLNFTAMPPKASTSAMSKLQGQINEKKDAELVRDKCLTLFLASKFGACEDPVLVDWELQKNMALEIINTHLLTK